MNELPAWEDPRRVLARHNLRAKRGMSQNFLVSRHAVEKIADALELEDGERVIELGPGLGTLTAALLRRGAQVLAIDADRDMLAVLAQEFADYPALDARFGDATELDLAGFEGIAVCGNLPYAVTGGIFRRLVEQYSRVSRAVLMVQKEVRDRLVAQAGTKQYGALTVFTRAVFDVRSVVVVPAGAFHPAPKVDSAVVALTPRAHTIVISDAFTSVVRASFEARRKTLRNALLRIRPPEVVDAALAAARIDGIRRGETLSVEEFATLASHV
ncbi:MAG TPA: 16S rRNA (adenine(1518)-N(6)/adenine(1519)-N(6))-dimethyltransferase RsmA [Polyangiales bacterium]|nr:16S rRNA (adenine(1518)-N(6)/adenine(1519)-N(6))-dimethyltransferase RsmA [Polyangiales bacterium]